MLDLELESSACVFNTTVPLEAVFNGVSFLIWKFEMRYFESKSESHLTQTVKPLISYLCEP